MFPIHIITTNRRIKTTTKRVLDVLKKERKQQYRRENATIRKRAYHILCGRCVYEIICYLIQYSKEQNANKYLVIPEFLIPRRPYPIYVYLYAMVLYSSDPKMSQREAAEKTRKRFDLEKFSHTTLGRAMKKLEARIKEKENEPKQAGEAKESAQPGAKCFPSVELTRKRKDTVLGYLKEASGNDSQLTQEPAQPQHTLNYKHPPYEGGFIEACHKIVEYTHKKFCGLLI